MSNNMNIRIHNVETGEIIDRPMNDKEIEQFNIDLRKQEDEKILLEAKATAKADLLNRLGITAEEAKLLLS